MLKFEAEPLEQLKARFPKALVKIWQVTNPMPDRPGLHRTNVFDFESGMRLLISMDMIVFARPEIHVSASWEFNEPRSIQQMNTLVINGYRSLGGKGVLHFLGFSEKAIPHWVVREES